MVAPNSLSGRIVWSFEVTARDRELIEAEQHRLEKANPGLQVSRTDAFRVLIERGASAEPKP